jgi:hypothetical protein
MATRKTRSTTRLKASAEATAEPARTARRAPAAPRERKKPTPRKSAAAARAERVRLRAYFLSLERNGSGDPMDDWLRAEREVAEEDDQS